MDNNELFKIITEKLSQNPELLKTVGDLTLDENDFKIAEEQTPDTMYVLTGRVEIKNENEDATVEYHYHPIIKNCLLNPEATANEVVSSPNLIELQEMKDKYSYPVCGVEYVILAIPMETYKKLQEQLDEMIAEILKNVRHAAESFMKNSEFSPNGLLSFEKIYQDILYQLMQMSNTVLGSALNDKSQIVSNVSNTVYNGLRIPQFTDGESCDENCEDCCDYFNDDEEDNDEDEDEDDDTGGTTVFFGFHK